MARLKDLYFNELREKLKNKFELNNIFEVPKIEKIVSIVLAEGGEYFIVRAHPMVGLPSGQRRQTVNLLSSSSVVRIRPPPPEGSAAKLSLFVAG